MIGSCGRCGYENQSLDASVISTIGLDLAQEFLPACSIVWPCSIRVLTVGIVDGKKRHEGEYGRVERVDKRAFDLLLI